MVENTYGFHLIQGFKDVLKFWHKKWNEKNINRPTYEYIMYSNENFKTKRTAIYFKLFHLLYSKSSSIIMLSYFVGYSLFLLVYFA